MTLSATLSAVLESTVDVVADKRLVDTSAALFTSPSDAFFSTRVALVGDRFFGRCADGAAASESAAVDSASGSSAGSLAVSAGGSPVLVSDDVDDVEVVDDGSDADDLVAVAPDAAVESELASADVDDSDLAGSDSVGLAQATP